MQTHSEQPDQDGHVTLKSEQKTCPRCGIEFTASTTALMFCGSPRMAFCPTHCETCTDLNEQEAEQNSAKKTADRERKRRQEAFEAITPPLYHESDPARLPKQTLKAASEYTINPTGLGFIGPAGKCKTRVMFTLVKRLVTEENKWCEAISATRFAKICADQFSDSDNEKRYASKRLSDFHKCDVLFIDDFGKNKMTERAEVELYDLLENRTGNMTPTLWTSNANARDLMGMLSEDRGEAIIRRLTEFSTIITC